MNNLRAAIAVAVAAAACASRPRKEQPRPPIPIPIATRPSCPAPLRPRTTSQAFMAAPETGASTLLDLEWFRKTVVLVNDAYVEPRRIDPRRMFVAIADALAASSEGSLRRERNLLTAASGHGARIDFEELDSIWQVPLRLQELGKFILRELPQGHPLAKGHFAEVVAANALLGTLDENSFLFAPAVIAALPRAPGGRTRAEGAGGQAGVTVAELPSGALHFRVGPFVADTSAALKSAIERTPAAGARGIVLDLRESQGGPLDATTKIADLFVDSGELFTEIYRDGVRPHLARFDAVASERAKVV